MTTLVTPAAARGKAARRLERRWADHLVGADPEAWPHAAVLDSGSTRDREANITGLLDWAATWRDERLPHGATLDTTTRMVATARRELPHRLVITDIDAATELAGGPWPDRLAAARDRLPRMRAASPADTITGSTLKSATDLAGTDFDILIAALDWFTSNREDGLTARQVPVPGLHSKWIEAHRPLLSALLGRDLRLAARPAHVDITHLDPDHLAAGGRRWDSLAVSGDPAARPAYPPRLVMVCENKDTATFFPQVPGGVAVYGSGTAVAALLPRLPWLADCPRLLYWGDMDAAGYAILNDLRATGFQIDSVLMDESAFLRYRHLGVNEHSDRRAIRVEKRQLPCLTDSESTAYKLANGPGPRRIEQERIPLEHAVGLLADAAPRDSKEAATSPRRLRAESGSSAGSREQSV